MCINKAVYISGFTFFCKIKLWGTKTMVNTCKERSLSYVFIAGQAKTKKHAGLSYLDCPCMIKLSWFYLNFIKIISIYDLSFCMSKPILDSPKIVWIRSKMTFHNFCLSFEPCQKSWSSPQEKHAELFYWGSSFLNIQIPSRLYADYTQILSG